MLTFTRIDNTRTVECHADAPFAFSVRLMDGGSEVDRIMRTSESSARELFERVVQQTIEGDYQW